MPQWLLLNHKINEILGNRGGAFCIAARFGFRSTKHLRAFSLSLQNERIKKAKPEIILPCVAADTLCPSSWETAALGKAQDGASVGGLSSAGPGPGEDPVCPGHSCGEYMSICPEKLLEQRPQFPPPCSSPRRAILALSFWRFQPQSGLANPMTLPYTFSNWILLLPEAQTLIPHFSNLLRSF